MTVFNINIKLNDEGHYFSNCLVLSDFSLDNWYNTMQLALNSQLSKLNAAKLLEELGVAQFLNREPCERSSTVYSPSVDGWKKGLYHPHIRLDIQLKKLYQTLVCQQVDHTSIFISPLLRFR